MSSSGGNRPEYEIAEVYAGLRQEALSLRPAAVGLSESDCGPVWAMLMETGYPEAVATLVAIADGTVSLYLSNGGGVIGAGQHPGPRRAAQALLEAAAGFVSQCARTEAHPLPRPEHTRFYLCTWEGTFTLEALEEDLGEDRHPMTPLFYAAHEVIAEVRAAQEQVEPGAG